MSVETSQTRRTSEKGINKRHTENGDNYALIPSYHAEARTRLRTQLKPPTIQRMAPKCVICLEENKQTGRDTSLRSLHSPAAEAKKKTCVRKKLLEMHSVFLA